MIKALTHAALVAFLIVASFQLVVRATVDVLITLERIE